MPPHFSLLVLLLFFLLLVVLYSFQYSSSQNAPVLRSRNAPATEFLSFFSSSSSNSTVSTHLRCLTRRPHLAGTPSSSSAAAYVLSRLRSAGLQTLTRTYSPLLSYPSSSSLSLLRPDHSLLKPLSLLEPADPSPSSGVVPPYHAYSPSGSAVAPPVFVNFGRDEDYVVLDKLGVEVSGKVVIVRRGMGPRGAVVAKAAEKGAEAVVMFGDRTDGGVERGTVMSGSVGDPLTPGWAAVGARGAERLREEDEEVRRRLPRIPSMPVSAETATEILRALGGPAAPEEWCFGAAAEVRGVGGGNVLLNFTYRR
ncbi:putative glutamate carboxypeptidase 2 [Iris pallida]|uniref:Glutamate carboxypeptidase 2 n=1 Tax=Iris pallida TaxID=29817 RepID=A0AAX6GD19_IRIPA|nr:putative glutamate carboxypeptidase 2 [Iris pallida]